MTDLSETVDTYLAGWSEVDAERRAALVARVWTTGGRLIDPPLEATGREEISQMAATLQSQFPGHRFQRVSGIDEHHDHFRFAWEFVAADGSVALSGLDVGELAEDGSIARITGFFGALPSNDAA
jgi:SnoaL-like domain